MGESVFLNVIGEEQMGTTRNMPKNGANERLGLAAIGSDGGWEVAIDETTSGAQKWFAQIEGQSVYLHFAIPSPSVIDKMIEFLTAPPKADNGLQSCQDGEIVIGKYKEEPVTLVRDDEFSDRYFVVVETKHKLVIRITVGGADLRSLVTALRQAKEDLDEAATN
jgi:hypothetical protein